MTSFVIGEDELSCPIELSLMKDPVLAEDGHMYEYENIKAWVEASGVSPITRQKMGTTFIRPLFIKKILEEYTHRNNITYTPTKECGLITTPSPFPIHEPQRTATTIVNTYEAKGVLLYLDENKLRSKRNREYIITTEMKRRLCTYENNFSKWTIALMKSFLAINNIPFRTSVKKDVLMSQLNELIFT